MSTVEHAVDCYFRVCRQCFTMHNVVCSGNRKFGLLASDLNSGSQYHIESTMNHGAFWQPSEEELFAEIDATFFGGLWGQQVVNAYRNVGFAPHFVERIYCSWTLPKLPNLQHSLHRYSSSRRVRMVQMISLRDEVFPQLKKTSLLSHMDENLLKTLDANLDSSEIDTEIIVAPGTTVESDYLRREASNWTAFYSKKC